MILYYAMGGGLGHVTRSLAILHESPELSKHIRLLASSKWTSLILPHAPCPVDRVAGEILSSKRNYVRFLDEYIRQHHIECVILDTFPFGIVGEWLHVGEKIPRILLARYLKWDAYLKRVNTTRGKAPSHTLILEPLAKHYAHFVQTRSHVTTLDAPILLPMERRHPCRQEETCLVVHSGDNAERQTLISLAQQTFGEDIQIDVIFPEMGMYPAEEQFLNYSKIVSGAGYNMTAAASQSPPDRRHLLHPFHRRFDNQSLRLRRLQHHELWSNSNHTGTHAAANWLRDCYTGG